MKILHAKNNNVERIAKYESYIKCLLMSKSKLGMLTLHCTRLIGAGTTINTNNSVH